ncbi:MAG: pitrilysin family protein [Acidobacteriota bacterium]
MPDIPDFELSRHTLGNGLRVVLHRDDRLPLVTVNLWYHVGSKNERPGRTGFAHLFEHLLFQGSQHVDTNGHFHLVQQAGGVANGSTWYDRTNYFETLPAHHLDLGLWLESDRMGYFLQAIDDEKLENQRSVVMNERRERVDNQPYGRAWEVLHESLYPEGHPYRWPVIGYMDDIAAATLDEVSDFFRRYYTPSNAVLTLAGDFDEAHALDRVEHWFGELPPGPPVEHPTVEPIVLDGERRTVLEDDVSLGRLYAGWPAPAYGERDWYTADLLSVVLAGGKASLLHEDLVYERQLASSIGTHVLPTELPSQMSIIAAARPGAELAEIEARIDAELVRLGDELLPDDVVERARNRLLTHHFDDLQQLADRADALSQHTTFFDAPEGVAREIERYREPTAEDLRNFVRQHLQPDRRAILHVVPREDRSGGTS